MKKIALASLAAVAATPALAHTGVGATHGLAAGLSHPLMGLDHLLAMLAVGLWGAKALPGRIWLAPLTFVTAMVAGALINWAGVPLPHVETAISASVLVLGLMVAAAGVIPVSAGLAVCAAFALFHGHAHAEEASGMLSTYAAGFVAMTASIHMSGAFVGRALLRVKLALPAVGAAIAGTGVGLLAG